MYVCIYFAVLNQYNMYVKENDPPLYLFLIAS